jgi:hypothetical protein
MLESDDQGNHSIAIETMANCDLQKSALNILFLLKYHGSAIYNSKTSTHVNFKSLLSFFNISRYNLNSYRGITYDDIIKMLTDKGLLTDEHISKIKPLVFEEYLNCAPSKYFTINDLIFSQKNDKD